MSEYQFYEFRSIDKPLTETEMDEIASWSSRTDPTPHGAVFVYNYGSFGRDELKAVEQYFDAMFYISNWGSARLVFKFPRDLVDLEAVGRYCMFEEIDIEKAGEHVLLDISYDDEEGGGGWVEGEGYLSSMIGLRESILRGDYRCLYLMWLQMCRLYFHRDDPQSELTEPPVPSGLNKLDGPLKTFVEAFGIDDEIVEVAGTWSAEEPDKGLDVQEAVGRLSTNEKNEFLLRLLDGEPLLAVKLIKRLEELSRDGYGFADTRETTPRNIRTILEEIEKYENRKKEAEQKRKETERLERLSKLARNEKTLWEKADRLISEKKSSAYGEAVKILADLKTLAVHRDTLAEYDGKIRNILEQYSRRSSLKAKMRIAGLIG